LFLQAGDVTDGYGAPGDLAIIPGLSSTSQGRIYVGSSTVGKALGDLHIRRLEVYTSAGDTIFQGQDTNEGTTITPGDLFLQAGNGVGSGSSAGGNIWIMPGTSEKGTAGSIIWGNAARDLTVTRNPDYNVGSGVNNEDTTLQGQNSLSGSGGDYNFFGGDGNDAGGILQLFGGQDDDDSSGVNGGDVSISAAAGRVNGGSVFINGGFGQEGDGGSVIFSAGSTGAAATNGGSITLTAGTGANTLRGNIIVGPNAGSFYVDNALVSAVPDFVTMISGSNTLVIRNSVTSVLSFNGRTILRTPLPTGVVAAPPSASIAVDQQSTYAILNSLTATVRGIVCALGQPSTGHDSHGLFNIVTTADIGTICDATNF
jgi:hypothetical protein